MVQSRLVKKEMKKTENFAPFDYAQGDCQTERSRSLFSRTKRHWNMVNNLCSFFCIHPE